MKKLSISVPVDLAALIQTSAEQAQVSVSAWMAQAARVRADADQQAQDRAAHRAAGLAAADEMLADLEPPSPESQRWADSVLAELGLTKDHRVAG